MGNSNKTIWQLVIDFIISKKINETFTRQELINYVTNNKKNYTNTIDTYRNYLFHAGFIKTKKLGVYIKVHNLSANLSILNVRKRAYSNSWENWFIPHEKL